MSAVIQARGRTRVFCLGAIYILTAFFGPEFLRSTAIQRAEQMSVVAGQESGAATDQKVPAPHPAQPVRFSSGVTDILLLVEAGVSVDVIKAFIQNSTVPYQPSAPEIVSLKERGVPGDIVVAMLQRGAELKAKRAAWIAEMLKRTAAQTGTISPAGSVPAAPAQPATSFVEPGYAPTAWVQPAYYNYWWSSFSYPLWSYWPVFYSKPYHHFRAWPHHAHNKIGQHGLRRAFHQQPAPWSHASAFQKTRARWQHGPIAQVHQPPAFPIGPHWGANRFHPPTALPGPHWGANLGNQIPKPLTGPHWGANRGAGAHFGRR